MEVYKDLKNVQKFQIFVMKQLGIPKKSEVGASRARPTSPIREIVADADRVRVLLTNVLGLVIPCKKIR